MPEFVRKLGVVLNSQKLDVMDNDIIANPTATDDYLTYSHPSRFVLDIVMVLSLMSCATFGVKVADALVFCSKIKYMSHFPSQKIADKTPKNVTSALQLELLEKYQALDPSKIWKLTSGKIVEATFQFAVR
ncbi:hypothetical protein DM01DRAFT_315306 [Hesseltinella vesiculosa]|uniref:Uncharacterized protein n=1 Tax=Hesseltinella vesiculosa TaxID=101127 RepID=A0A1X2GRZ0_9FUNG|nr:hypothetical protein DM01DRAFT_315306 [Hesseltinella vesiculosa]